MAIFRAQNNVPEVYPNMSRDFQILCRALDIVQNNVKYDMDKITDVLNTDVCDSSILPLLQLKVGFYSDKLIADDDLRIILKAFPHIKFYKGSLKGIKLAINTYLKIRPTKLDSIRITNKYTHTINIVFAEQARDLFILDEILKFIIPPGFSIAYTYAKYSDRYESTNLDFVDFVVYDKITDSKWSTIVSDRCSNNSHIRNFVDNSNIKLLTKNGLVSRMRSSVNVGSIKRVNYSEVNLQEN